MKKTITLTVIILIMINCTNNTTKKIDFSLSSTTIPDLYYFNSNRVLKNEAIVFINKDDTVMQFIYDENFRQKTYLNYKTFARRENIKYFNNSSLPIAKFINTDFSLNYNSSLIQLNDTIISYWYDGLGSIEDTATYIFNDNRLSELISSPLNDYDKIKTKKIFYYKNNALIKIVTLPIFFQPLITKKIDSIITHYDYKSNLINQITEKFYFKNQQNNYTNSYLFNDKGFPIKFIEKDTIEYKIIIQ